MNPAGFRTLDVGDPQIVRDLAEHNHVTLVETEDGWVNALLNGTVYKAPTETAAA